MGRAPCCDKTSVKRGPWSPEEDTTLKNYIQRFGTGGNWIALPHKAGLKRCGKSCRLRWLNYLRPDIKHGGFTEEEDNIILTLYNTIGSRWSVIASHLPRRTDNDVKNYWNTKLKKKLLEKNTSHAMHFSSTLPPSPFVPQVNSYCYNYGNSDFSNNNYQQNLPSSDPVRVSILPRLMEIPDQIGSSEGGNYSFRAISSSQEVSTSLLPFENRDGLWSGNEGGGDDDNGLLMDLVGSGLSNNDLLSGF